MTSDINFSVINKYNVFLTNSLIVHESICIVLLLLGTETLFSFTLAED